MRTAHASLSRRVATAVVALLALAAGALTATGCGDDSAEKPLRTIYLSVPQHGKLTSRGDDMEDAARLALDQTNYDTPDVRVELRIVDSSEQVERVQSAREDDAAVAYIFDGEPYESGGGPDPIDGGTVKDALLGISLAPATAGHSGRAVAPGLDTIHLLPSAEYSGMALAQAVAADTPASVTLHAGPTPFARSAAAGFMSAIKQTAIPVRRTRSGTGVNAVTGPATVYGADRPQTEDPSSDGLLVTPALPSAGYPPSGAKFAERFENAYGRKPDRWAVWVYEATGLALDAITGAGEGDGATSGAGVDRPTGAKAVTRDRVRRAAFGLTNRFGPVGHYDVQPDGQTTLYAFAIRPWPLDEDAEGEDPRVIEVNR